MNHSNHLVAIHDKRDAVAVLRTLQAARYAFPHGGVYARTLIHGPPAAGTEPLCDYASASTRARLCRMPKTEMPSNQRSSLSTRRAQAPTCLRCWKRRLFHRLSLRHRCGPNKQQLPNSGFVTDTPRVVELANGDDGFGQR